MITSVQGPLSCCSRGREFGLQDVPHPLVKVRPSEVVVPGNTKDADGFAIHVEQRRVQCTTSYVVYENMAYPRCPMQIVGHGSCSWLLQNAHDLEPCLLESRLRRLYVFVLKLGRHADDGPGDGVADVLCHRLLHVPHNLCANVDRRFPPDG
mmetsp:Transcript_42804/g.96644  ORF Transcript_42804/g.96644 Transcript_42804/m.96644 type:complete len:152 (+) Transcript_42804:422-877(+)